MKTLKSEFKKIVASTITNKYRKHMSNICHYHRKRSVGSTKIISESSKDYIEEFGMKWGFGSGNNIGCRVYVNTGEVIVWAIIGCKHCTVNSFVFKKSPNEIATNKNLNLIKEMITTSECDYLRANGYSFQN